MIEEWAPLEKYSLTRFEVAKAILYLSIGLQVVSGLFDVLALGVDIASTSSRPGAFMPSTLPSIYLVVRRSIPLTSVLLFPLVSLLAHAMVGEQGNTSIHSLRDLRALWWPCLGVMLGGGLPRALYTPVVLGIIDQSVPAFSSYNVDVYMPLLRCSFGLMLAVYPSARDQFRRAKSAGAQGTV